VAERFPFDYEEGLPDDGRPFSVSVPIGGIHSADKPSLNGLKADSFADWKTGVGLVQRHERQLGSNSPIRLTVSHQPYPYPAGEGKRGGR
jgi:hypothetical protein